MFWSLKVEIKLAEFFPSEGQRDNLLQVSLLASNSLKHSLCLNEGILPMFLHVLFLVHMSVSKFPLYEDTVIILD